MTELEYLNDTYLFESSANFLEVKTSEGSTSGDNTKRTAVILDKTIFYPQGGGQPADQGVIATASSIFNVTDVRLDEDGLVWHFGEFEGDVFNAEDSVNLKIDKERRIINTKNHSAGHLLDCAVEKLGIPNITPTKGFHFPEGPNVEYEGMIENPQELIPELQKAIDELISQDTKIEFTSLSPEEAKAQGVWAPEGKFARVVNFEGFESCGCGGTHVRSASEIGKITIRKIKCKKGNTKIAYVVE
jgi:Ser-tRNA(Ala) deacylase AlaX